MLSAVSPEKMPIVLQNIRKVIKVRNFYIYYSQYVTLSLLLLDILFLCDEFIPIFLVPSQMVMCCFGTMLLETLLRLTFLSLLVFCLKFDKCTIHCPYTFSYD